MGVLRDELQDVAHWGSKRELVLGAPEKAGLVLAVEAGDLCVGRFEEIECLGRSQDTRQLDVDEVRSCR